jgi:hypothetical protein
MGGEKDAVQEQAAARTGTDAKAEAASEKKSEKGARIPFSSLADPAELLLCHNELVRTAEELGVKALAAESFDSLEQGAEACETLYARIIEAREKELAAKKSKSKKGQGKMAKTATAPRAAKKAAPAPKKTAAAPKKAAKAAPAAESGEVRSLKFSSDSKITWVGDKDGKNPFREGSGRHARTELLRKHNGKTVKTFLGNGGLTKTLIFCESEGYVKVG